MKNFKFLLATTAILSMGAVAANADVGDETVVPVRAEIVTVHNLHATPIDFGRIAVDDVEFDAGSYLFVGMDQAGIVTSSERSSVPGYILSNGKKGVVKGTDCEHLDFANKVDMSVPTTQDDVARASADIKCISVDGDATFYGEFKLSITMSGEMVPAGNYTGSLTVTEINPEP